eukprot:2705973-Amphidinium_carterae.1
MQETHFAAAGSVEYGHCQIMSQATDTKQLTHTKDSNRIVKLPWPAWRTVAHLELLRRLSLPRNPKAYLTITHDSAQSTVILTMVVTSCVLRLSTRSIHSCDGLSVATRYDNVASSLKTAPSVNCVQTPSTRAV